MWVCAIIFLLASGVALAQGQQCPDGSTNVARVELHVQAESETVDVSPESVTIEMDDRRGPSRVCWVADELPQGWTIHIEGEEGFFPGRQRTIRPESLFANSGRPKKAGIWVYEVNLEGPEGQTISVDPEVIINKGGGG